MRKTLHRRSTMWRDAVGGSSRSWRSTDSGKNSCLPSLRIYLYKSLIFSGFFFTISAGSRPYMPPGQHRFPVPLWLREAARRRRRCAAEAPLGRRACVARTAADGHSDAVAAQQTRRTHGHHADTTRQAGADRTHQEQSKNGAGTERTCSHHDHGPIFSYQRRGSSGRTCRGPNF